MMINLKLTTRNLIEGQSLAEYVTLISVVLVALLAMQVYMKRGIQAAIRYSTDQFGNQDADETDPDKGMITHFVTDTISEGASRKQQQNTAYGVRTTYTTQDSSESTGEGNSWRDDNLTL